MPSPTYTNIDERGGTAFPLQTPDGEDDHSGMDLHDWFTGMALSGLLANPASDVSKLTALSDAVHSARHCADEVLQRKSQDYGATP